MTTEPRLVSDELTALEGLPDGSLTAAEVRFLIATIRAERERAQVREGAALVVTEGLLHDLESERATVKALREALDYAANMPDAENMPEWAKELRHRAREALAGTHSDTGEGK